MTEYKEALLDRFPISEVELDDLSHFFPYLDIFFVSTKDNEDLPSTFSSSSSCVTRLLDVWDQIRTSAHEDERLSTILPYYLSILQSTVQNAYVVGMWEDDNPRLYRHAQWLEGIVTLLGRRKSSTNFPTALYHAVVALQNHSLEDPLNNTSNDSSDSSNSEIVILNNNDGSEHNESIQQNTTNHLAETRVLARVLLLTLQYGSCYLNTTSNQHDTNKEEDFVQPMSSQLLDELSWAQSMSQDSPYISLEDWTAWSERAVPNLSEMASSLFHTILLPHHSLPSSRIHHLPLHKDSKLSKYTQDSVLSSTIRQQLSLLGVGSCWDCLYDSNSHGFSFHSFAHALVGYHGSTLILIQSKAGHILGMYTKVPWKISPNWYTDEGHDESFLFRLYPGWNVYRRVSTMTNEQGGSTSSHHPPAYAQFLSVPMASKNSPWYAHSSSNGLRGLAMGGVGAHTPRLHITDTLEECTASAFDLVFESGPLLSSSTTNNGTCSNNSSHATLDFESTYRFDVDVLVAWAVSGSIEMQQQGFQAGHMKQAIHESTRQQAAQVDRTQFVDDFASGAYMNNLYTHRVQSRGRADFVADEEDGKGYYIADKPPSPSRIRCKTFHQ
jgi:hypothetical protein